jgi:hypothetical protein
VGRSEFGGFLRSAVFTTDRSVIGPGPGLVGEGARSPLPLDRFAADRSLDTHCVDRQVVDRLRTVWFFDEHSHPPHVRSP